MRFTVLAGTAALAAAAGAVALHTAGAATASPFTVVGGSIRTATGTPTPPSGTHASLWGSRSTASTTLDGSGRVVLGAIGDYCEGWPTVRVTVDGAAVGDTTIVDASRYGNYPVGRPVGAGRHAVVVSFVNDHMTAACDRNVHVGFAAMESTGAPAPTAPAPSTPAPTTGRPGPGSTGVPAGTRLTVHEGDLTVTTDGTVIDALDIHGYLKIRADNVTVRRSVVRGGVATGPGFSQLVSAFPGDQVNFVIEDSTLVAAHPSAYMDGLKGSNFTARRLDISNVVDTSLVFGDDVTIEDSWLHGNTHFAPFPPAPDNRTHDDSLQIEGGTNILVRHNVFEGAYNSAMMLTQNHSRTSNVRVTGNWLSGGGCTVNLSEKGKGPFLGIQFSDNRFGTSRLADCPIIAPPTSPVTLHDDVWDATGQPITVRRGS